MGEAKRRKTSGNMWMTDMTSPEVRKLICGGGPVILHFVWSKMILAFAFTTPRNDNDLMKTEYRPMRLAFSTYDRIRTGEIGPSWQCSVCARERRGEPAAIVVVEQALPPPAPNKPAVSCAFCTECEPLGEEKIKRRIFEAFGVCELPDGTA
jgi:hypothetical protein